MTDSGYIEIAEGLYDIGLDADELNALFAKNSLLPVNKEYILNSCPKHKFFVSHTLISSKAVSYKEFLSFVSETGYVTDAEKDGWGWVWDCGWLKRSGVDFRKPFGCKADIPYSEAAEVVPVMQVSWNDAKAYCSWKSEILNSIIRLPFEEEWEAASVKFGCRGIRSILDEADKKNLSSMEYIEEVISVSLKEPFPSGILWEWTESWFDKYRGGFDNREFGTTYKVLRGGSLLSEPYQRSSEYRFRRCPTARSPYYSFRTALAT